MNQQNVLLKDPKIPIFRARFLQRQQNLPSLALVPVGLASQGWIPELLKGRHGRIEPALRRVRPVMCSKSGNLGAVSTCLNQLELFWT